MATRCFSPPESFAGSPVEKVLNAEQAHHLIQADKALAARRQLHPISQVATDGQVREQTTVLKNITDGALFRLLVDTERRNRKEPGL